MCINVDANGDVMVVLSSVNYYEVIMIIKFTGLSSELSHSNY